MGIRTAWSQVIDGGETQPLARLRIWPRFVTVAFSNLEMVSLSRSRHNGCLLKVFVFKMATKKVDHVTSRLTPLPPLYQRLHWRRGQEASGWTNSYFSLHPRPLSSHHHQNFRHFLVALSLWIHFLLRDQNLLKIKLDLSFSTLKSDPMGFYPPASSRQVDLQVLAGVLYENK